MAKSSTRKKPSTIHLQPLTKLVEIDTKNITIGARVGFTRKGFYLEGDVVQLREQTAMIQLSPEDAKLLDIETHFTVVRYEKCTLL